MRAPAARGAVRPAAAPACAAPRRRPRRVVRPVRGYQREAVWLPQKARAGMQAGRQRHVTRASWTARSTACGETTKNLPPSSPQAALAPADVDVAADAFTQDIVAMENK